MKAKKQLRRLENAHRALAARSDALFQVSKIIFPIIGTISPGIAKRLTTSIYDATNAHMDRLKYDDEYQQMVRESMDEICALILMVSNKP